MFMLGVKICSKHVLQKNLTCVIESSNVDNFLFVLKREKLFTDCIRNLKN